jgi:hypothetical protein
MIALQHLKDSGIQPRVHGNGFIQLDVGQGQRLHVWGDDRIPRQSVRSSIHDHAFDFFSLCLVGSITNETYELVQPTHAAPGGSYATHRVWNPVARFGEDTRLVETGIVGRPGQTGREVVDAGQWYSMRRGVLHDTSVREPTATLMFKVSTQFPGEPSARVLLPIGAEPDNKFDRNTAAEPDLLWAIIRDVLGPECDL